MRELILLRHAHAEPAAAGESDLDRPTGLVVSQVLAELRKTEPFRGRPPGFIENGGYTIVSTVDASACHTVNHTTSRVSGSARTSSGASPAPRRPRSTIAATG